VPGPFTFLSFFLPFLLRLEWDGWRRKKRDHESKFRCRGWLRASFEILFVFCVRLGPRCVRWAAPLSGMRVYVPLRLEFSFSAVLQWKNCPLASAPQAGELDGILIGISRGR
jgi:hypothetical protein